jgi:hypothetical protein
MQNTFSAAVSAVTVAVIMMVNVQEIAQCIIWLAQSKSIVSCGTISAVHAGKILLSGKQFDANLTNLKKVEVWKSPNLLDSCGHEEDAECISLPCQHIPKKSAGLQNLQLGIIKMVVHKV